MPDLDNSTINTYQLCTGYIKLNNANYVDFNLGKANPQGMFLWEKKTAFPPSFSQDFTPVKGNCTSPAILYEDADAKKRLQYILPTFHLANDGSSTWLDDVNIVPVSSYVKAGDPDPEKSPLCSYGSFTMRGDPFKQSDKATGPTITVIAPLTQENEPVGLYTIEVKMKLAPK